MKVKRIRIYFLLLLFLILLAIQVFLARPEHTTAPASDTDAPTASETDLSEKDVYSQSDISPTDTVVSSSDTSTEPTASVEVDLNQYATVTVKSAAMRKSGSSDAKLIRYISKGQKVIVLEYKKKWYRVDFNGSVGWVNESCLELIRNHELEATLYAPIPEQLPGEIQSLSGTATEKYIKQIAAENSVAGLSVAVIKNGDVAYHYEYGYANKADKRKVTVNTKFRIASLSKVFTSMLAVRLSDDGKLDLDKHIGDILGIKVRNPNYKNNSITTRMLLTHTSSLIDRSIIFSASIKKDLKSDDVYSSAKPGTQHTYSNFGMGVAGAVIEKSSGQYLTNYAQSVFFDPMGIDAGFDGTKLDDKTDVADCMVRDTVEKSAGEIVKKKETNPIGQNHSLAAGGLLISSVDFAKVTTILINGGVYDGNRYLSTSAVDEIHTPCIEAKLYTQCIGIRKSDNVLPNRTVYYHTGAAYGVFSLVIYDLEDKSGVVILTTGSLDYSDSNGIRTVCSDIAELVYADVLT